MCVCVCGKFSNLSQYVCVCGLVESLAIYHNVGIWRGGGGSLLNAVGGESSENYGT